MRTRTSRRAPGSASSPISTGCSGSSWRSTVRSARRGHAGAGSPPRGSSSRWPRRCWRVGTSWSTWTSSAPTSQGDRFARWRRSPRRGPSSVARSASATRSSPGSSGRVPSSSEDGSRSCPVNVAPGSHAFVRPSTWTRPTSRPTARRRRAWPGTTPASVSAGPIRRCGRRRASCSVAASAREPPTPVPRPPRSSTERLPRCPPASSARSCVPTWASSTRRSPGLRSRTGQTCDRRQADGGCLAGVSRDP